MKVEAEEMIWNDIFIYDETSPSCLRWKVDRYWGPRAGSSVGVLHPKGYWRIQLLKRSYGCHRIIVEMHGTKLVKADCIDHIDGDRDNNRLANLRVVTNQANCRNKGKTYKNTSGVVGVYLQRESISSRLYWSSIWSDLSGKRLTKTFSVNNYGNDEAFRLACAYRVKMIEELNLAGAGYTERHGIAVAHVKAKDLALEM